MDINKIIAPLIIAVLFMSAMTAVYAETAQETIPKIVIGTTMDVQDIDLGDFSFNVFTDILVRPKLIVLNSDGEFVGDLAESWESDVAKTWTFHLTKNATWDDGVPVTSEDVKFTMQYKMEKIPSWAQQWPYIDTIETPDEYTLVFRLKEPNRNFIYSLESSVVPEHIFKDIDDPLAFDEMEAITGSGPYKFEKYDEGSGTLVYRSNGNYWGRKPIVDVVEVKLYKNLDVMQMALQNGEIDVPYNYPSGIPYFYISNILKDSDLKCNISKRLAVSKVLWMNNDRKPYDDPKFRTALSYAINYDELVRLLTGGFGEVADAGFIPKGTPHYIETRPMTYDKNQSIELLDDMGYKDVNSDGIREDSDGKEFSVVITVGPEDQSSDDYRVGQLAKTYLNDVGLDVQLKYMDENPFYEMMDTTKEFDIFIGGAGSWLFTDYAGYWTGAFDYRSWGWAMVRDPAYLALVDDLKSTTDEDKVGEIVADMQQFYASNMPAIPLYTVDYIQPYNKIYEGWGDHYIWKIFCEDTFYNLHEVN